jgi:hypothetical protein
MVWRMMRPPDPQTRGKTMGSKRKAQPDEPAEAAQTEQQPEGDDVEGHSILMTDPTASRYVARAREDEVQRQLARRAIEDDARRARAQRPRDNPSGRDAR